MKQTAVSHWPLTSCLPPPSSCRAQPDETRQNRIPGCLRQLGLPADPVKEVPPPRLLLPPGGGMSSQQEGGAGAQEESPCFPLWFNERERGSDSVLLARAHSHAPVSIPLPPTDARSLALSPSTTHPTQSHVRRAANSVAGRAELGAVGQLQAEMLHLELIDGADGFRGDRDSSKASATAAPALIQDPAAPVTMDTYRPKRPTTLNLFPIVPRTQVRVPA